MKIYISKIDCEPLFRKGDKFIIMNINTNPNLMEIEAMKLKSKRIYGFNEGELELL